MYMTMATALPTALMLSGLPNEEVREVLSTNSGLFNMDSSILEVWGISDSIAPEISDTNTWETFIKSIGNEKIVASKKDNYYLDVAETLERNILGSVSIPPEAVASDDENHNDTNGNASSSVNSGNTVNNGNNDEADTDTELVSGMLSIALKSIEYTENTEEKLNFYCDIIDQVVQKYEEFIQQSHGQYREEEVHDQENENNQNQTNENQTNENQKPDEENTTQPETQETPQEEQKDNKRNNIQINYQNRNLLDLFGNIRDYQPCRFSQIKPEEREQNRAVVSRVNGEELPGHIMVRCITPNCNFKEPNYFDKFS